MTAKDFELSQKAKPDPSEEHPTEAQLDAVYRPSVATLPEPEVDASQDLIEKVSADCVKIKEMAWNLRNLLKQLDDANANFDVSDLDRSKATLLDAHGTFVLAERDLYDLKARVERTVDDWNCRRPISQRVCLIHTMEGLPIRVDARRKVPIFGF